MTPSALVEQPWLTPRALAEKLGVSVRTLDDWRRDGRGPEYLRVSYLACFRRALLGASGSVATGSGCGSGERRIAHDF